DSSTAILAAAASSLVPAEHGVGYFGTDDRAAVQAAFRAAQYVAYPTPDGTDLYGTSQAVYFPAGRYWISDEIVLGPFPYQNQFLTVFSDQRAIVEQTTAGKRSFVFQGTYTVRVAGITF